MFNVWPFKKKTQIIANHLAARIEHYPLHTLRDISANISPAEAKRNLGIFTRSIEDRKAILLEFVKQNEFELQISGTDIFEIWPWIHKYSGYCLGAYPRLPYVTEVASFGSGWPYAPGLIALINDFSAILGVAPLSRVPTANWTTARDNDPELPKELRYYKIGISGLDDSSNGFFDVRITEIQELSRNIFISSFYRFSGKTIIIDPWYDINYIRSFIGEATARA